MADKVVYLMHTATRLTDIGLNLTHPQYDADRDAVIARAQEAGVHRFVLTGTSVDESVAVVNEAVHRGQGFYATVGIHPHEASTFNQEALHNLETLLSAPQVVAVGETGLDFNRMFSPQEAQITSLKAHIDVAARYNKPLFLHDRDASDALTGILEETHGRWTSGVVHCFTGNREALRRYLDLGLYIGITGWVCDERRGLDVRDLLAEIPPERLLLETDGPYLLPRDLPKNALHPEHKRRNEPAYLPHIAATVAAVRGESLDALIAYTTHNAERLFRFSV